MARRPRLFGKQLYHHVYAWGNDRHPLFKADANYEKYLEYLSLYSEKFKIEVIAYALMECHVHLFVFDPHGKLSQFMEELHGRYAQLYNRTNKRAGHVFGERFNNKIVQPNNYGLWLSRYIHRQAVEAGIVNHPKDYPWTSYHIYIGLSPKRFIKPEIILEQFGQGKDLYQQYKEFVANEDDGPISWHRTKTSIVGDSKFVEDVKTSEGRIKVREHGGKEMINLASSLLAVRPEALLNPRGRNERKVRHQAFAILVEEYGHSASAVARAFRVTTRAVIKVLKNNV